MVSKETWLFMRIRTVIVDRDTGYLLAVDASSSIKALAFSIMGYITVKGAREYL